MFSIFLHRFIYDQEIVDKEIVQTALSISQKKEKIFLHHFSIEYPLSYFIISSNTLPWLTIEATTHRTTIRCFRSPQLLNASHNTSILSWRSQIDRSERRNLIEKGLQKSCTGWLTRSFPRGIYDNPLCGKLCCFNGSRHFRQAIRYTEIYVHAVSSWSRHTFTRIIRTTSCCCAGC